MALRRNLERPNTCVSEASQVASLLNEFGRRALLYGGNPYRAKAYLRATERVALLTEPLDDLVRQNRFARFQAWARQ